MFKVPFRDIQGGYWTADNIHERVDSIIINITRDGESGDDVDDIFLESGND